MEKSQFLKALRWSMRFMASIVRAIFRSLWFVLKTVWFVIFDDLDDESKKDKDRKEKDKGSGSAGSNITLLFQVNGNRLDGFALDGFNAQPPRFERTIS